MYIYDISSLRVKASKDFEVPVTSNPDGGNEEHMNILQHINVGTTASYGPAQRPLDYSAHS
jgi:hypothetical protein